MLIPVGFTGKHVFVCQPPVLWLFGTIGNEWGALELEPAGNANS